MVPKEGYWRANIYTDTFFECLNTEACLGSKKPPKQLSLTGECAEGYRSNLCNSCEIGYSQASKHTCVECSNTDNAILKLVGLLVIAVVLSIVIVYTSMASATKPKSLKSIYFKILLNHFQLVSITSAMKLNWPKLVNIYLRSQENLGILTYQLLSIDCLIKSDDYESYIERVYYTKLIIVASIPVIIILGCVFYWSIMSCYKYSTIYLRRELIASIIILLFFAHPSIVISLFSSFNCMEIEPGEYWLIDSLDIRCWKGSHSFYVLAVSLPGIVAWCLGIPIICLYMLHKNRRFLDKVQVRLKYAYLFNGYKKEYYYWEFLILYRKIILITCAVFLGNSSQDLQALSVMIIMIISLHLQHTRAPYVYPQLNALELRSIIVVSTTIYSGLYFLTDHLTYEVNVGLFVLILATNAYFLIDWVKNMIIETKIYEFIPYLKKKWSKTIRDTFNINLFVKKGNKESTQFSNLVLNQTAIADLFPPLPVRYYDKNFSIKDFYFEIVELKNGLLKNEPIESNGKENLSTKHFYDEYDSDQAPYPKNRNQLSPLLRHSSVSFESQEDASIRNSSKQITKNIKPSLGCKPKIMDECQIMGTRKVRIKETYENSNIQIEYSEY
jgi:hypothetical protein